MKLTQSVLFSLMLATGAMLPLSGMNESKLESYKNSRAYNNLVYHLQMEEHQIDVSVLVEQIKKMDEACGVEIGSELLQELFVTADKSLKKTMSFYAKLLHQAAAYGYLGVATMLLKAVQDPYAYACMQDRAGCTALHYAASGGCIEIVELLLDTAFSYEDASHLITIEDNNAVTASHRARIKAGHFPRNEQKRNQYFDIANFIDNYLTNKYVKI